MTCFTWTLNFSTEIMGIRKFRDTDHPGKIELSMLKHKEPSRTVLQTDLPIFKFYSFLNDKSNPKY